MRDGTALRGPREALIPANEKAIDAGRHAADVWKPTWDSAPEGFMSKDRQILFHEYGTELRLEPDGSLVLNVLCGRVGQYGVEFPLSNTESKAYHTGGDDYVRVLSRAVRKDPQPYATRGRTY